MSEKTFNEKIIAIQSELKAPKNQYNKFGKFAYRNCEGILEGVKPLLTKYGLLQTISDDIVQIGERYYIKATVTVEDEQIMRMDDDNKHLTILDGSNKSATAFAREPENKKGMDESQITGTASSYARKYALNGMWLIDDSRDSDNKPETKKPELKPNTEGWNKAIHSLVNANIKIGFIKDNYTITKEDLALLEVEYKKVGGEV